MARFLRTHSDNRFVFANASFDIDVLEKATEWKAHSQIEKDLIYDILIMYRLYNLATLGSVPRKFSLSEVTQQLFGITLEKDQGSDVTLNSSKARKYKKYR